MARRIGFVRYAKGAGSRILFLLTLILTALAAATYIVGTPAARNINAIVPSSREEPVTSTLPPQIGAVAPDFRLMDYDGKRSYRLSQARGRKVLITFFCGCGPCHSLAPIWQDIHQTAPGVVVLGVSTLSSGHAERFSHATKLTFPLLFDPNYKVAEQYDSIYCPRSWVVDEAGVIRYTSRPEDSIDEVRGKLQNYLLRSL